MPLSSQGSRRTAQGHRSVKRDRCVRRQFRRRPGPAPPASLFRHNEPAIHGTLRARRRAQGASPPSLPRVVVEGCNSLQVDRKGTSSVVLISPSFLQPRSEVRSPLAVLNSARLAPIPRPLFPKNRTPPLDSCFAARPPDCLCETACISYVVPASGLAPSSDGVVLLSLQVHHHW